MQIVSVDIYFLDIYFAFWSFFSTVTKTLSPTMTYPVIKLSHHSVHQFFWSELTSELHDIVCYIGPMTNCACCSPIFNSEVSLIHDILDFIMENERCCRLQTAHVHHMIIETTMIIIVCSPTLGKIDWHHTSWTQRDPIIPSLCHVPSGLNESITVSRRRCSLCYTGRQTVHQ